MDRLCGGGCLSGGGEAVMGGSRRGQQIGLTELSQAGVGALPPSPYFFCQTKGRKGFLAIARATSRCHSPGFPTWDRSLCLQGKSVE